MATKTRRGVSASVAVDDVRTAFYKLPQVVDNYAFWITQILLDPNEAIIRDDDSATLYRVPFKIDGDEVVFDLWQPVKIEYVDSPVAAMRVEATFISAAASRRPAPPKKAASAATAGTKEPTEPEYNPAWVSTSDRARITAAEGQAAQKPQIDDYNPAWLSTTEHQRIAAAQAGHRPLCTHARD